MKLTSNQEMGEACRRLGLAPAAAEGARDEIGASLDAD